MRLNIKPPIVLAMTAIALIASQGSALAETVRATDTGTGVVKGVVIWRGKPLAGAQVHLSDYNKRAFTNQAGRFTFTGIPPFKNLRLYAYVGDKKKLQHTIEHSGNTWSLTMGEGETKDVMLGDPVESVIHNTSTGAVYKRETPPGGWVKRVVRVIDAQTRKPIEGVAVIHSPYATQTPTYLRVRPGPDAVGAPATARVPPILVDEQAELVYNLGAQGGRTNSKGEVTIDDNDVAGVTVLALVDTHCWRLIRPGEIGWYRKGGVITFEMKPKGGVRGSFTIGGKPVTGGAVSLFCEEAFSQHLEYDRTITGVTNKDGRFEVLGFTSGRYTLTLSKREGVKTVSATKALKIADGQFVSHDVDIATGDASLYGVARGVNGPTKSARVTARPVARPEVSYAMATDQFGRFLIEGIKEGPYKVTISPSAGSNFASSIDVKGETEHEFMLGLRSVMARLTFPDAPEGMVRPTIIRAHLMRQGNIPDKPRDPNGPRVTLKGSCEPVQGRVSFEGNFHGLYLLTMETKVKSPSGPNTYFRSLNVPEHIEIDNYSQNVDLGDVTLPDEGYRRVRLLIRTEMGKPPKEYSVDLVELKATGYYRERRYRRTHEKLKDGVFEWYVRRPGRHPITIAAPGYVTVNEAIEVKQEFEREYVLKPE